MTDDLQVELRGRELWLSTDRHASREALLGGTGAALAAEVEGATARDDVRVVVLAVARPAPGAGTDVHGQGAHGRVDVTSTERLNRLVRSVVACDKPVVASVAGVASGAGAALALACDLQVCSESASFVLDATATGLMPDGGTSATVAAATGRARAMRLALLAEPMGAREAHEAGLVSHCVPDQEHDVVLREVLDRLAAGPPLALAATKKAVNAACLPDLHGALDRERSGQAVLVRTEDVAEGLAASTDGRRPLFTGG